jgi:hypothetical protein
MGRLRKHLPKAYRHIDIADWSNGHVMGGALGLMIYD